MILVGVKVTNMLWLICIWKFAVRDAVHATFNSVLPLPAGKAEEDGPETVPMKLAENGLSAIRGPANILFCHCSTHHVCKQPDGAPPPDVRQQQEPPERQYTPVRGVLPALLYSRN